jgi:hypothetical protein
LAPIAYLSMFSIFNAYDDEGYFLITVKEYLSGQPLFTQALPVYGPFFYEVMGGLFKVLGLEPTNDNGRFVTLAVWLTASLMVGLAAYRLTQSKWLGLGAQIVTFYALTALVDEPTHPSGLVSLLLACLVFAATLKAARPRATAAVIGGIVAGLFLVKINVGAFAAVAVAFAFTGSLSRPHRRFLLPLMAFVLMALPPVLMAGLSNNDWVLEFAAVATLSGAAVGLACVVATPGPAPAPSTAWLVSGGALIAVSSVGIALAGGTRLQDLLNGPLLLAFRFPGIFAFPLRIGPGHVLWAVLSLAAAFSVFAWRLQARAPVAVTGMVRVAVGFLTWATLLRLPTSVLLLALPLVWVATLPPRGVAVDSIGPYPRLLLPALAVLQSLQAYPVAGTQLSIVGIALVPVGAISICDGMQELRLAGLESRPPRANQGAWVGPAAMLAGVAATLYLAFVTATGFIAKTPLGLPGAELVRVPADQGTQLRSLVASIDRYCGSFITIPGMNSFYFWTLQESPVQLDSEVWWSVLNGAQQQSILQQLETRQRLCVVKDQRLVEFWADGGQAPRRPLVDFIDSSFSAVGSYGEYQLLVRADR